MGKRYLQMEAQRDAQKSEQKSESRIEKTLEKLTEKKSDLRRIHEDLLPDMAKKLLKNRSWTYGDLYVKWLEQVAAEYEIPVFDIYTEKEFLEQIRQKRQQYVSAGRVQPEYDIYLSEISCE